MLTFSFSFFPIVLFYIFVYLNFYRHGLTSRSEGCMLEGLSLECLPGQCRRLPRTFFTWLLASLWEMLLTQFSVVLLCSKLIFSHIISCMDIFPVLLCSKLTFLHVVSCVIVFPFKMQQTRDLLASSYLPWKIIFLQLFHCFLHHKPTNTAHDSPNVEIKDLWLSEEWNYKRHVIFNL